MRFKRAKRKYEVATAMFVSSLALVGCGGGGGGATGTVGDSTALPTPVSTGVSLFTAATAPAKLSAWNIARSDGQLLTLPQEVVPYSLNTSLFSDYSHKFRTIWLPAGTHMDYTAEGPLQFPVGAIVTKTFFYPQATASTPGRIGALQVEQVDGGESLDLSANRLIETRLMVREPSGRWGAVTYVWDADQKDANLVRGGQNIDIELVSAQGTRTPFVYAVPSDSQCLTCHATNVATGTFEAIGPQANNLNRNYTYSTGESNQLDQLVSLQMLSGYLAPASKMVVWNDPAVPVSQRVRAYLDVNCASCHNSNGRAGNTGLWLGVGVTDSLRQGICKAPVGGQQNGRFSFDVSPGDADASFLYYRLANYRPNSTPPRVAMPELGRHVFHAEGNTLVRDWINGMTPGCTP